MIRVNREELLGKLESVQPGLAPREIVEQSSCFVFKGSTVMTYNDEVACRLPTGFKIKGAGAVQAQPLLAILRKLQEEEIEIETDAEFFRVKGKRRTAGIRMEQEVLLPIDSVDEPGEWKALHDDFSDAISIVQECAGKDESQFWVTCIHLHPKWVEACDNFQITRYKLKTGLTGPTLVRSSSIKHIISLGMTEFSETESWLHFRNPDGLVFSCRRYVEDFPDMSRFLECAGQEVALPKGLGEAVEKAEIFSSENADSNQVRVELRPGKLKIKGTGVSGWYSETKKMRYDGKPMSFLITPKLLLEITKRHNECQIDAGAERLKVDGGKFTYVACLGKEDEKEEANDAD